MRFQAGRTIVRRALHPDGRIGAVQCGRVVADDERGLRLWLDTGSATMRRTAFDGTPTRPLPYRTELTMPTVLAPSVWRPHRTLMLMPPGAAHSVWWSWAADGTFTGWYVNLETPARRWSGGVDVRDQTLDVRVAPDRSWQWKDVDEFAAQTGDPLFFDADEAAAIRAEGQRVIDAAERGVFPFDGTWCDFRPAESWSPTDMPYWWDVPAEAGPAGGSTLVVVTDPEIKVEDETATEAPEPIATHYLTSIDEVVEHLRAASQLGLGVHVRSYLEADEDTEHFAERWEFELLTSSPVHHEEPHEEPEAEAGADESAAY